ncbi:MAG: methyltransferase [Bryobacteraceae bacterium]
MATLSHRVEAHPSVEHIFRTANAFTQSAALKSAIELGLFTAIAEGNTGVNAIARRCDASERGIRILCDFLTIIGLLTKNGRDYGLTPESAAYLDRNSPTYLGSAVDFLNSEYVFQHFGALTEAVRRGGTAINHEGAMAANHPMWQIFARAMGPMMKLPALSIVQLLDSGSGKIGKVLDIAAGHGVFGITLAARRPEAEIFAVDWDNVLKVARENAASAGVQGRYHTIEGSAFDVEFGTGYDVVLLTNFLHHLDPPAIDGLLRKVHAALKPGGRVVTLEFVPNEDRVSPPAAAAFSLTMLASTERGDAYTAREYESMFRKAGFSRPEFHLLTPSPEQAIICRR